MRTIKFKGKSLINGQWFSGDLAHSLDGKLNIFGFVEEEEEGKIGFTGAHKIDPTTLCQFTGFLDKNGNEIYEGDVLRSDEYPYSCIGDKKRDNYYAVVYYCEEGACFGTVTVKNPNSSVSGISDSILDDVEREKMKRFEVIGNIHDTEWKQYREYIQEEDKEQNP